MLMELQLHYWTNSNTTTVADGNALEQADTVITVADGSGIANNDLIGWH